MFQFLSDRKRSGVKVQKPMFFAFALSRKKANTHSTGHFGSSFLLLNDRILRTKRLNSVFAQSGAKAFRTRATGRLKYTALGRSWIPCTESCSGIIWFGVQEQNQRTTGKPLNARQHYDKHMQFRCAN